MTTDQDVEVKEAKSEVVGEMVRLGLGERAGEISLLADQGNVNRAYDVRTKSGSFILRVRFNSDKLEQFIAEKQCADLVRENYEWTPEIITVGQYEEHAYSIQDKVQGIVASRYQGDLVQVWEQIGRCAACFHSIRTPGYIYNLFKEKSAAQRNWCQWYFDYLGKAEDSKLVAQGFLTHTEFEAALQALLPLESLVFEPTLAHGNLSLKNTIVDNTGQAHIVDWGTCQGHLSIELDVADLLASGVPDKHVEAYLRGHNLSSNFIDQNKLLLERLLLIRVLTSAIWCCDIISCRQKYMDNFLNKIREGTQFLLGC